MAAKLLPGQLLHQFLQRPNPAGQRNERVGTLEHQPLALMHVRRDDQFLNARQRVLARSEKIRNNAGDGAAVIEYRSGERAHQPDRAAAIDEADTVLRENLS